MLFRIRTLCFLVGLLCCSPATIGFAQERNAAEDRQFKLELFKQAIAFKEASDRTEIIAEVTIALGLASEPEFSHFLTTQTDDGDSKSWNQFVAFREARAAASYCQNNFARLVFDRLEPTIEKLELALHLAFSFGFESKKAELLNLVEAVEAMKGKKVTVIGGVIGEGDDIRELDEEKLGHLRDEMFCAYHCGRSMGGQPLDKNFASEIDNSLLRDLVRLHRIRFLKRTGEVAEALREILALESVRLRHAVTYQIGEAVVADEVETKDKAALGKALFAGFLASVKKQLIVDEVCFNPDFCFEELERLDCEQPTEDLLVNEVDEEVELADVVRVVHRLGVLVDGEEVVLRIEDESVRGEWLKAVLRLKEEDGAFEAAWAASRRLSTTFGFECGDSADSYAESLVRSAVHARRFQAAEKLLSQIQDTAKQDAARDYLVIHRGNDADLERARALAPKAFEEFDRKLAEVKPEKQLEWLLTSSVGFRGRIGGYHPLHGRIKREVEVRRDSRSRQMVAKRAKSFLYSFTKPDKASLRLIAEFTRILEVDPTPSNRAMDGIDTVLGRIEKQRIISPKQLARYDKLLKRFCSKIENKPDRESMFADIALVMAKKGFRDQVVELNGLISDNATKVDSLINCALAYPPVTKPINDLPIFERRFRGGWSGDNLF